MKFNFHPNQAAFRRASLSILAIAGLTFALLSKPASGATINWGNSAFDTVMDSQGNELSNGSFLFQLGVFDGIFVPDLDNVDQWAANWVVFDASGYNQAADLFYSEARFIEYVGTNNPEGFVVGGSDSDAPGVNRSYNFAGKQAYIWIRNGVDPVPGTEWFLATLAGSWEFPTPSGECCDNGLTLNWEVQDLGSTTPIFGAQGASIGGGYATSPTSQNTIQTYTFIPEPSSALLIAASMIVLLRRRRCAE
jgi:hypothetical protein